MDVDGCCRWMLYMDVDGCRWYLRILKFLPALAIWLSGLSGCANQRVGHPSPDGRFVASEDQIYSV